VALKTVKLRHQKSCIKAFKLYAFVEEKSELQNIIIQLVISQSFVFHRGVQNSAFKKCLNKNQKRNLHNFLHGFIYIAGATH